MTDMSVGSGGIRNDRLPGRVSGSFALLVAGLPFHVISIAQGRRSYYPGCTSHAANETSAIYSISIESYSVTLMLRLSNMYRGFRVRIIRSRSGKWCESNFILSVAERASGSFRPSGPAAVDARLCTPGGGAWVRGTEGS